MEIKELLKTLPALSGTDFTIFQTESENYPYVLISYSFYKEKNGSYTYAVYSKREYDRYFTATKQFYSSGSNSSYYLYGTRIYYYDLASNEWFFAFSGVRNSDLTYITVNEEILRGNLDTIVFSTRNIYVHDTNDVGYVEDYRFPLSSRKRLDNHFNGDSVFTDEHLNQLGYVEGDHIFHIRPNSSMEYLIVLKNVAEGSFITARHESTSMTYGLPTGVTLKGLSYSHSSGSYSVVSSPSTYSTRTMDMDKYFSYSTLDIKFDNRLMRVADHYLPAGIIRDEVLSVDQTAINCTIKPSLTGKTSPDGLKIEEVLSLGDVFNLKKDVEGMEIILPVRAGNSHPIDHTVTLFKEVVLPDALKEFKTPHNDIVIVRTQSTGEYQLYQINATSTQKFALSTYGRIESNENIWAEYPLNYDALSDTWTQSTKRTYGVYKYASGNISQTAATVDSIVYSTVDFYDSKYTTLLREKDARVNCNVSNYYTLDENLLIDEVQAVYNPSSDAIVVLANSTASRVNVYVIKNAKNNFIKQKVDSSTYFFYFNEATTLHEFIINRSDYSLASSKVTESATSIPYISATKGSLRELVEFTSIDSYLNEDTTTLVIPKQKMPRKPLPEALKNFKTPYNGLVIMEGKTEGIYSVRTFVASEGQKIHLNDSGDLVSADKFALYETSLAFNESTNDWEYISSSSKKTHGPKNTISRDTYLPSSCNVDQVVYSSVDLYDSNYTSIQREKDEGTNCSTDDYFVLDEKILEMDGVSGVFNPATDGLIYTNDNNTYHTLLILKNALNKHIEVNLTTYYANFYPPEPMTVYKATFKPGATSVTFSSKQYSASDYTNYFYINSQWFREQFFFTNIPVLSRDTGTVGVEIVKAQKMPLIEIDPFEKPVINSLTISPATPQEGQDVEFTYDVTYDRATFKAEEWENKQDNYEAGQHTVRVRVQDSNDLWSDWKELSFTVEAVYQKPTISNLVMTPSQPQVGEEVSFNYDKNLDPRLELKSENWTNKKSSYEAGTHTVNLTITDSANQVSNELSVTFSIEQPYVPTAPVLKSIKMTPETPKPGETVTFSYEADLDETATVQEEIWEGKLDSYEAGDHEVALTVVDSFGQHSNRKTLSFSVERVKDKPVISNLRMTPENPTIDDDVVFTYDMVIDPDLTLKSENWVNKQSRYEEGTHTVELNITDSADQVSNTLSLTFEVTYVPEAPVLESISISPENPKVGEVVEFNYMAYVDERATIAEEIWEGKQDIYAEGDYEVSLTIVDSFGQQSNRVTLPFTVEALPEPEEPELPEVPEDPEPPIEEEPPVIVPPGDENLPAMPDSFPYIYDIVIDPPNPRAGELLSYSYTVALEAGTCLETMTWTNKRMIYDEAGEVEMALKLVDSKGQEAQKAVTVEILEPSETPHPPKPLRVKHLEVTRWDSVNKRFIILEGRER